MKTYLALILLLPITGGLFNALVGRTLPRRAGESIACGVILGSFAFAVMAAIEFSGAEKIEYAEWFSSFDLQVPFALYLDQFSLTLILMITFVCGLIHLYSVGYMREEPDFARYFALLNIFVFAMLLLVLAENLPLLYLGWEGVGFCSYALIGFWYREEKNATAGRKAFIVTRIGDTAFGIAIVWIYQLFGTLSIQEINGLNLPPAGIVTALGLLLLIGAAGKSAQLPLSVWLPDAMAGPTPVSAQIHAATMVTAGVYLLARMFPLIGASSAMLTAIACTGAFTAFYAATCACAQRDLKRILAYSTISQIGYMIMGVGAGALTAANFHLLTHAFFKALLFLGAGCVITALHHQQDIYRMGGLRKKLPTIYWCFLAGALCLAGFPLTGGFFSKDAILGAVYLNSSPLYIFLFVLGMLTALLTSFYTFRMLFVVFHGGTYSLVFPPPFQGEGRGGDGVDVEISASCCTRSHPHPNLPLEGEETTAKSEFLYGAAGSRNGKFLQLPLVMTTTLLPLALLGLFGGLLDLPEYFGLKGQLSGFFSSIPGFQIQPQTSHYMEITIQLSAAAVSLLGLWLAWMRYIGDSRAKILSTEEAGSPFRNFLENGWYLDSLYRLILIRPFILVSELLLNQCEEAGVQRFTRLVADSVTRLGMLPVAWNNGKVAVSLYGLVSGVCLALIYLAWVSV